MKNLLRPTFCFIEEDTTRSFINLQYYTYTRRLFRGTKEGYGCQRHVGSSQWVLKGSECSIPSLKSCNYNNIHLDCWAEAFYLFLSSTTTSLLIAAYYLKEMVTAPGDSTVTEEAQNGLLSPVTHWGMLKTPASNLRQLRYQGQGRRRRRRSC